MQHFLNKYGVLSFLFVFYSFTLCQNSDTLWTKHYDNNGWDIFYKVIQTADSNFVCVGNTHPFDNKDRDSDFLVTKTSGFGDVIWNRYSETLALEGFSSVIEMKDHGDDLLLVGGYAGELSSGGDNVYIVRTDNFGNIRWEKRFDYDNFIDSGRDIVKTYDHNYIVLAVGGEVVENWQDLGVSPFNDNIWLLKINIRGDTLWTKSFDLGFLFDESPSKIIQTSDSCFVVTGSIHTPLTSPWEDLFIAKFDHNGELLWNKIYGSDGYDNGMDIKRTKDGGFIIVGKYVKNFETENNADIWLLKTDVNGDTLWTKTYGGYNSEWGNSIEITPDNGYIMTGVTETFGAGFWDVWVVRTDSLGDTLWTKTFGNVSGDLGYSIAKTFDDGYIIGGVYTALDGGSRDGYLIRLAPENPTDIKGHKNQISNEFKLFQNYPNPFNPSTTIKYTIPTPPKFSPLARGRTKVGFVTLKVYDILGKEVTSLVNEKKQPGNYEINFNASSLSSGMYFYELRSGNFREVKKMLLLR